MIESAVTDLPQPDSPTIPSVLPSSTAKQIAVHRADDALAGEEVRLQVVDLEEAASVFLRLPRSRVERVAQPVGDEVRARARASRSMMLGTAIDVRLDAVDVAPFLRHRAPATRPAG